MQPLIAEVLASENINGDSYFIAVLDGEKCPKFKSFLEQIGYAFEFPDYYSRNMNSLDECINDLDWLNKPNYLLIIKNSKSFLNSEPETLRNEILAFLSGVSKEWANVPNFKSEELHRSKADFRIVFR